MNRTQINHIMLIYVFLLFGSMIAEALTPNWIELFNVWPANQMAMKGVLASVITALGIKSMITKKI